MTQTSITLQDLRERIYVKAKAQPSWRFWARAQKRQGFGWEKWNREFLYGTLHLFNKYKVQYGARPTALAAPLSFLSL